MGLNLLNYHSYEHYVDSIEPVLNYYEQVLKFKKIGYSTLESEKTLGMRRVVLAGAQEIHLILTQPIEDWSIAAKYLKKHPEGVAFLNFRVKNFADTCAFLKKHGATFLFEPQTIEDKYGRFSQLAITSALDDVSYRFIDDSQYKNFAPQFVMEQAAGSYSSPIGLLCIDHVTVNVRTLVPLLCFYREVLGFQDFWDIEFHTNDVNPALPVGSGLKSKVMWDPESGIKFANNEPAAPYFRNSQIDIYLDDNHGSGIQHLAFKVTDIISTMEKVHSTGGKFLNAPTAYYEKVDARLAANGFKGNIRENRNELKKHSILLDANPKGYLLQIFSLELWRQLNRERCGYLFYEIIQREGDEGFGGGNFRALFETIEIDQIAMKKTAQKLPLELI